MAKCDQGYLCEVCDLQVEQMIDSDLYLRYILGEVPADQLLSASERHIRCNPTIAQFIIDPAFDPVVVDGPFDKAELDPADVACREERITKAWRHLQALPGSGIPVSEYPLKENTRSAQRLALDVRR